MADWEKFARQARPSTNIEDHRSAPGIPSQRVSDAFDQLDPATMNPKGMSYGSDGYQPADHGEGYTDDSTAGIPQKPGGYSEGGTVLKNKSYKMKSFAAGGPTDSNSAGSWGAGTGEAPSTYTGAAPGAPPAPPAPDDVGGGLTGGDGFGVKGGGTGAAGSDENYDESLYNEYGGMQQDYNEGGDMAMADGGAIPDPGGAIPSDPDDPGEMQDDQTGQQSQAGDQGMDSSTNPGMQQSQGQQNQAASPQGTPPEVLQALSAARQSSGLTDADFGAPAGGQVQSDNSSPDQGVQGAATGGAIAPQPQSGGLPTPGQQGGKQQTIMKYLSGASAMPQQTLKQAEQKVDPKGILNPTARTMEVITLLTKQNPKAGAAALQAYRQQYNTMSAGARVSLHGGAKGPPNMTTAAQNATLALTNVPDGKNVAVVPNPDGKSFTAHIRPVGKNSPPQGQPQQALPQPQQQPQGGIQSQAGGGPVVKGFDDGGDPGDQVQPAIPQPVDPAQAGGGEQTDYSQTGPLQQLQANGQQGNTAADTATDTVQLSAQQLDQIMKKPFDDHVTKGTDAVIKEAVADSGVHQAGGALMGATGDLDKGGKPGTSGTQGPPGDGPPGSSGGAQPPMGTKDWHTGTDGKPVIDPPGSTDAANARARANRPTDASTVGVNRGGQQSFTTVPSEGGKQGSAAPSGKGSGVTVDGVDPFEKYDSADVREALQMSGRNIPKALELLKADAQEKGGRAAAQTLEETKGEYKLKDRALENQGWSDRANIQGGARTQAAKIAAQAKNSSDPVLAAKARIIAAALANPATDPETEKALMDGAREIQQMHARPQGQQQGQQQDQGNQGGTPPRPNVGPNGPKIKLIGGKWMMAGPDGNPVPYAAAAGQQ